MTFSSYTIVIATSIQKVLLFFSTDVRENTVISGHQEIQTLFAANNVVYPDSISVNSMNAPGNSTVQVKRRNQICF